MWESVIINTLQDNKKLSIELSCTAFEASCNNCNFDSQQMLY